MKSVTWLFAPVDPSRIRCLGVKDEPVENLVDLEVGYRRDFVITTPASDTPFTMYGYVYNISDEEQGDDLVHHIDIRLAPQVIRVQLTYHVRPDGAVIVDDPSWMLTADFV